MKTIILIHGRKQRNSNDFEEMVDWFGEVNINSQVMNLTWYDNYNLETFSEQYLNNLLDETASNIKGDTVEIIGYSTGALLVPMLAERVSNKTVKTFYVVPLVVELQNENIKNYLNSFFEKSEKFLEDIKNSSSSEEEYNSKINELKDKKEIDLYTRENYKYTRVLLEQYRDGILKDTNGHFLFSTDDIIIDTVNSSKLLREHNITDISEDEFHHGLIFRNHKDIFKQWYLKLK